jgi:hypothetical protein
MSTFGPKRTSGTGRLIALADSRSLRPGSNRMVRQWPILNRLSHHMVRSEARRSFWNNPGKGAFVYRSSSVGGQQWR